MTPEQHTIIIREALLLLQQQSDAQLKALHIWLTPEHVDWCLENIYYPMSEGDRKREKLLEEIHQKLDELQKQGEPPKPEPYMWRTE